MNPLASPPIITLITDFGLSDHYVGTMKGVLLSLCPDARLVDISHDIPAFSVYAGAYALDQAAPYFPAGTIHVIVVDPGVGTTRKPLLVEALNQYFIAPDNGVLSMIVARDANARAREITNHDLWLKSPSSTFHGRDIFAPVAAALASGATTPEDAGPAAARIERLTDLSPQESQPGMWRGKVLSVDRFGNVITNFRAAAFPGITAVPFGLLIGDREITLFGKAFGDMPQSLCFAYFGSSGYIEAGINQASAAAHLKASPGDSIGLRLYDLPTPRD